MRNLTKGMSVKETQSWVAMQKSRRNQMTPIERREFETELHLLDAEWSARWEVKAYRFFTSIGVWMAAAFIIIGGVAYKILQ